jgi:hypothetical protein
MGEHILVKPVGVQISTFNHKQAPQLNVQVNQAAMPAAGIHLMTDARCRMDMTTDY